MKIIRVVLGVATAIVVFASCPLVFAADKGFKSPSGNIRCVLTSSDEYEISEPVLACSMNKVDHETFGKCGDFGARNFLLFASAGSPGMDCGMAKSLDELPMLNYGSSWSAAGFKCLSKKTGINCQNSHGDGFNLSKTEQRVF
jgi:hypothetical protein